MVKRLLYEIVTLQSEDGTAIVAVVLFLASMIVGCHFIWVCNHAGL